jgi:hypothetical protein
MNYIDNQYIIANDLSFVGILHDIKKSRNALAPVFEAFTNAIEAIKIKAEQQKDFKGNIVISINATENTDKTSNFESISITDNGIGFDEKEFKRFNTFKETSKGYKNLGSGRIQFVHFFNNTIVKSVFSDNNKFYEREFVVSKSKAFIDKNAIVLHRYCKETNVSETGTTIIFNTIIENSLLYNTLNEQTLKTALLERYIHYFCYNRNNLPKIELKFHIHSKLKRKETINKTDIPDIDNTDKINLPYSQVSPNAKSIVKLDKTESFSIDAFKVKKDFLKSNKLNLVSKGEIVEDSNVVLQSLSEGDHVKGYKYLFLVSSDYIDARDTNIRGELKIPDKDTFSNHPSLFTSEEILIEEIQDGINSSINNMYPEIKEVKKQHDEQLEKLKEMFLIDEDTASEINISINDSESKILEKFYEAEAKKSASIDATIKESIDRLDKLDTTSENYNEQLKKEIDTLVKVIPLQNKTSLTHYVARRKLVLDLFDKILKRKLEIQKNNKSNFDEALIHNLLFQQGSENPESSDLWIINEDFIYFKGSSEKQLSKLVLNGEKVFKEIFTIEEERYLSSLGENRKIKRPDVLLFPEEGKCIIVEFKSPDVNASEHLTQIDFYANLILNYTEDKFNITTFYGYLIGENIEPRDVLGRVSRYEHSYQFDYLYRPAEKVNGFDGRPNGSIYTEVLKYTTLLERARSRNQIFIKKLQ